jgi:hypothetical protein
MQETREKLAKYEIQQREAAQQKTVQDQYDRKQKLAGRVHHLKGTKAAPGVLASNIRLRDATGHVEWIASPRSNRLVNRSSTTANSSTEAMTEQDLTSNRDYAEWLKVNVGRNARKLSISIQPNQGLPDSKRVSGPFLPRNWLKQRLETKTHQSLRMSTDFYDTRNYISKERTRERDARVSTLPMSIPRVIKFDAAPSSIQAGLYQSLVNNTHMTKFQSDRPAFKNVLPPISHQD